MKILWYYIAVLCLYFLFWYIIYPIISLLAIPFVSLTTWALEGEKTKIKKILTAPAFALGFLFGNLVPSLLKSGIIFAITKHFMVDASYPVIYAVSGGIICLCAAPSGEINLLGLLISLAAYILFMVFFSSLGMDIGGATIIVGATVMRYVSYALIIVLVVGIFIGIVHWVISKIKKDPPK